MNHFKFHFILGLLSMGAAFFVPKSRAGNLPDSIPKGWRVPEGSFTDVVMGTDTTVKHSGKASGFLRRAPNPLYRSGTMIQSIAADPYRNKKVRLTVYVKSQEVESAFLTMVVEGSDTYLTGANTFGKPIHETIDWTAYHITLDIPEQSMSIVFGAVLLGQGILWVDDYKLEVVDNSIPSDDLLGSGREAKKFPKHNYLPNATAINLDFEDQ